MHCGGGRSFKGILNLIKDKEKEENSLFQKGHTPACPDCGYEINGVFKWCPRCGSRMVPYNCEYCQGIVPRDAATCPRCGAPAG